MTRLSVLLKEDETRALWTLSEQERRKPRAQAALLIRTELERLGLLPAAQPTGPAVKAGER